MLYSSECDDQSQLPTENWNSIHLSVCLLLFKHLPLQTWQDLSVSHYLSGNCVKADKSLARNKRRHWTRNGRQREGEGANLE